jgi:hypothetical protein
MLRGTPTEPILHKLSVEQVTFPGHATIVRDNTGTEDLQAKFKVVAQFDIGGAVSDNGTMSLVTPAPTYISTLLNSSTNDSLLSEE